MYSLAYNRPIFWLAGIQDPPCVIHAKGVRLVSSPILWLTLSALLYNPYLLLSSKDTPTDIVSILGSLLPVCQIGDIPVLLRVSIFICTYPPGVNQWYQTIKIVSMTFFEVLPVLCENWWNPISIYSLGSFIRFLRNGSTSQFPHD